MNITPLCPTYKDLIPIVFQALQELGGSGTNDEITEKVIELMELPDEVVDLSHGGKNSSLTELEYQIGWAKTYLRKYGVVDNSARRV